MQVGHYAEALKLACMLKRTQDFNLDQQQRTAELTHTGREFLAIRGATLGGLWKNSRHRDEVVGMALAALHLFHADRHYLVRDGKVHIIDESTGRIAQGRQWSRGLHQLIELKEGCKPTGEQQTIAQITYQRFFPRYLRLAGTSGTLDEARRELLAVYGLEVARVPLHRPSRRRMQPLRMYPTEQAKWDAVVASIIELRGENRPVLVGTDSVAASEHLGRLLQAAGQPHTVLNALQDQEEAHIVARAGQPGQVTIATNMAGRGTDIPLEPEAAERGGLHVICCQLNNARRIDRQLHGRCGRQGDPGSVETLLSLQDLLIAKHLPGQLVIWLTRRSRHDASFPPWLGRFLAAWPQHLEEKRQRQQRAQMLAQDVLFEKGLAFSGKSE
jgi:preprotein translocase subunit SecA